MERQTDRRTDRLRVYKMKEVEGMRSFLLACEGCICNRVAWRKVERNGKKERKDEGSEERRERML